MEDDFLLLRLKQRDEQALAQLLDQYGGFVLACVRAAGVGLLSEADVEEAAADAFLKLWHSAGNITPEKGTLKSYLGAVARNEARSRVRRIRPAVPLEEDFLSPQEAAVHCALEQEECSALLRQALNTLEPATKEVFVRYYYRGQKTAQIAMEMHMNASTVRSRLARGRSALCKALQERGISHEDVV